MPPLYRIPLLLAILLLSLFKSSQSSACTCEGLVSLHEALAHSDIVFSGQVISKELGTDISKYGLTVNRDTGRDQALEDAFAVIRIKVDKVYKGKTTSRIITILTPPFGSACGVSFQVGKRFIVYATNSDEVSGKLIGSEARKSNVYWTNLCTRTSLWSKPEEEAILAVEK